MSWVKFVTIVETSRPNPPQCFVASSRPSRVSRPMSATVSCWTFPICAFAVPARLICAWRILATAEPLVMSMPAVDTMSCTVFRWASLIFANWIWP